MYNTLHVSFSMLLKINLILGGNSALKLLILDFTTKNDLISYANGILCCYMYMY